MMAAALIFACLALLAPSAAVDGPHAFAEALEGFVSRTVQPHFLAGVFAAGVTRQSPSAEEAALDLADGLQERLSRHWDRLRKNKNAIKELYEDGGRTRPPSS